jgi:hypothetical protein
MEEENFATGSNPNVKSPDFADFVKTCITRRHTLNKHVCVHTYTNLRIFQILLLLCRFESADFQELTNCKHIYKNKKNGMVRSFVPVAQ